MGNPTYLFPVALLAIVVAYFIIKRARSASYAPLSFVNKHVSVMSRKDKSIYYKAGPDAELWRMEFWRIGHNSCPLLKVPLVGFNMKDGKVTVTHGSGIVNEFAITADEYIVMKKIGEEDLDHMDDDDVRGVIIVNECGARLYVDEEHPDISDNMFFGTDVHGASLCLLAGPGVTLKTERVLMEDVAQ